MAVAVVVAVVVVVVDGRCPATATATTTSTTTTFRGYRGITAPAHWLLVGGCLVVGKPDVFWARIRRHGSK